MKRAWSDIQQEAWMKMETFVRGKAKDGRTSAFDREFYERVSLLMVGTVKDIQSEEEQPPDTH